MKHFLAFRCGFAIASALFLFIIMPHHGSSQEDGGRRTAEVATKFELLQKIPQVLGDDYMPTDGYKTFFEVKADAVVVVERNGVKTLRVYRGR